MATKTVTVAFEDTKRIRDHSRIVQAIEAMEGHHVRLATDSFSADDLLALFVDPAHRKVLVDAWTLVEPSGSTQELYVMVDLPDWAIDPIGQHPGTVQLVFSWHRHNCEHCFYVPHKEGAKKDTAVRVRPDAPADLIERFMTAATDLIDVHWRWSQVLKVYRSLNLPDVCPTPAAMRYVWPCIYTLCRRAKLNDIADSIETASERAGGRARVPRELIDLLRPTNETVMKALLLDGIAPPPLSPIHYVLAHRFPRL